MDLPETGDILDSLGAYDVVYFSAITLSIYSVEGREQLFGALHRARKHGARVVFDTNFRARGWPDAAIARAVFDEAFAVSDIVLAATEDLLPLYPDESDERLLERIRCDETVLKLLKPGKHRTVCRGFARGKGGARHAAHRRHDGGRRQLRGCLYCRTACGRRTGGGRPSRASSGRRRGMPSRRHHSAFGDAGKYFAAATIHW